MSDTSVLTRAADPAAVIDQHTARVRLGRSADVPGTERTGGIWWPRSLDLVSELRLLLCELTAAGQRACRITYNLDAWQPAPSTFTDDGTRIRLGGYRHLSPRVLHVTSSDSPEPLVLLVLPPSIDPLVAEAALGSVRQQVAS